MKKKVIDLEILEDFLESGVSKISLVDSPAIEVDWFAFKDEKFVYPGAGEKQDDFIPRCISYVVGEGKDPDQATAICYSIWDEKHSLDPSALPPYTDQITEDKKKKEYLEEAQEGLNILGYNTEYFWVCPGALATFKDLLVQELDEDTIGMVRAAAVIADKVFQMEAEVKDKGISTKEQVKQAVVLVEDFKDIIAEVDARLGTSHDIAYMDEHVNVIYGYLNQEENFASYNTYEKIVISNFLRDIRQEYGLRFASIEDLKVGDPVSWKTADQNPRGRIREIVRNGGKTVPGTSFILQGTPEDPGYIIEIYEKVNGEWKPTGTYAGRKAGSILKNVELWRAERQVFANEDEQIVVGPAMIPDMEIIRRDEEGNPYYVKFTKEVVAKIAEKFMRELRNDQTNIEHEDNEAGSYVMETWIVEDPEHDKINTKYGFNLPEGTWAVKMRVKDPETWKMIKAGKLNGFSIEGNFMSREDYEDFVKDKKTYERITKILKSI